MTIKALRQAVADNNREQAALKAEGRKLMGIAADVRTPEQSARISAVEGELDALAAKAEQIAVDLARAERFAADEIASAPAITVRERFEDDPKKGFKSHVDFCTAVMQSSMGRADDRLASLRAAAGSDEAGNYSDPHGGYLVPEGLAPGLLTLQPEDDPIGARTRKVPMANPVVSFNARVDKNHSSSVTGGLTVSRRPETVEPASSRQEFERVTLRATSLFGLSYATEEILQDSPISFVSLLSTGFSQEFGSKLIDERLNGSGVGEFEGVNNSPALISVTKETNQAADTIQFENVNKMAARCWGYQGAIWLANQDTKTQVTTLYMPIGTSGDRIPIYQQGSEAAPQGTLLGRPIYFTEYCKTLGDAGDIVLVNWNEYLEGTYQPMQSAESMHVRFVAHERTFKFWMRNDGRGWWRTAMTPKNSSVTLSPFVRLAARA